MKKILLIVCLALLTFACKDIDKKMETKSNPEVAQPDLSKYPQGLQDVFAAHGGLDKWNAMQSLTFTMPKPTGDETHTTDLKSRKIVVETDKFKLGSDGKQIWIAQDSTHFDTKRARFYHNLMFYFYAMPFLLADDGIVYSDAPALELEGVKYPGIKIGYKANIGDSPEDEYILYYHPETKKMAYLGYTVTYFDKVKSDQFSYIKYGEWQDVKGLLLPKSITWYDVENNKPTKPSGKAVLFTKVDIDKVKLDSSMFEKPKNGTFVAE